MVYDCVIIGGGPAGLNAALVLGRARRNVLLLDHNRPRNAVTHASHGFLTRDGVTPAEFRRIANEEVQRYPSVELRSAAVTEISRPFAGFRIATESGETFLTRKVLIAAGLKETYPEIPGLKELYGKSLFHCPYCDGWELRDQPLIVLADHPRALHLTKLLYQWSRDLVVCTNSRTVLTEEQKQLLASRNIPVTELRVTAFHGREGRLRQVEFADGSRIDRSGGFIVPQWEPYHAAFLGGLGCEMTETGGIRTDEAGRSTVPGLYAAGESVSGTSTQLILAAASGSMAAVSINTDLMEEDFA